MRADTISRMRLLDWPDDAPAPQIDTMQPVGLRHREILLVRDLDVVAAPADVAIAIRSELGDCLRVALRPVNGRVPPNAAVVLFRDESEMLAALLVAHIDDQVAEQWWWEQADLATDPTSALLGAAVPLAAVLDTAAASSSPAEVAALVTPQALLTVVRTICAQHDFTFCIADVEFDSPPSDSGGLDLATGVDVASSGRTIVVARGPTVLARSADTTEALRVLLADIAAIAVGRTAPPPNVPATSGADHVTRERSQVAAPERHADVKASGPTLPGEHEPAARAVPGTPTVEPLNRHDQPDEDNRAGAGRDAPVAGSDGSTAAVPGAAQDVPTLFTRSLPEHQDPSAPPREDEQADVRRFTSACAGVFYLVNPVLDLDVGPDIADTTPWELFEAVALGAVSRRPPDPIWELLRDLAQRHRETPMSNRLAAAGRILAAELGARLDLERRELADIVTAAGDVEVTAGDIDVFFRLDDVQLAIRRRGMDSDPGWVPVLGRAIRFHYGAPTGRSGR